MIKSFKVSEKNSETKNCHLRKEGLVPAVIYGGALKENQLIQIDEKTLLSMFREKTRGSIIPLELNGTVENCVIKEIQKSGFGKVLHVDFQAIGKNEMLKLNISINFIGQDAISEKGLVFEAIENTIEFHGTAENIPETVEFDVSKFNFDDKIQAKDIVLPKGVTIAIDPETVLAVVRA